MRYAGPFAETVHPAFDAEDTLLPAIDVNCKSAFFATISDLVHLSIVDVLPVSRTMVDPVIADRANYVVTVTIMA